MPTLRRPPARRSSSSYHRFSSEERWKRREEASTTFSTTRTTGGTTGGENHHNNNNRSSSLPKASSSSSCHEYNNNVVIHKLLPLRTNSSTTSRSSTTAVLRTGQTLISTKKQNLYAGTHHLPLWGIRKVPINPVDGDDFFLKFAPNTLRTTNYGGIWTFLPISLSQQFMRLPNLWYLLISILQLLLTKADPTRPWVAIIPFCVFVLLTFIKDVCQEILRYRRDRLTNSQQLHVLDGRQAHHRMVQRGQLTVGNIVRVFANQECPADIVVLSAGRYDRAYADVSYLEGATVAQVKTPVEDTKSDLSLSALMSIRGRIVCDAPNNCLTDFCGSLKLKNRPRLTGLHFQNFMLQGCRIDRKSVV